MSSTTRAPRVPFALLVLGLVVGGMVLLLALNTASAANELERHNLATKDQSVAAQVQQLRNEVALSAAPGNLARAAAELGMVPAANPAFIVVGADGSVKVLGKPKAVSGVPTVLAPVATPKTSTPAKPSTTPKASPSKTSATPSATGKSGAKRHRPTKTPTRTTVKTTPKPTPTPTPTLTLPGGHR
jgi:hypothetical protein